MTPQQSREPPKSEDLTGRDRIVSNVAVNWGSHLIRVAAGFIAPRLIDHSLGQEALGVWDFCWSLVVLLTLVQVGLVSSVNAYVAKYRAVGDLEGINRAASSAGALFLMMGFIALSLAAGFGAALPALFGDRLGTYARDAQIVTLILGCNFAFEVWTTVFGGILTGCHRWGIHNAIHAATNLSLLGGFVAVLHAGGDLPALALVAFSAETVGRAVRVIVCFRVLPSLSMRPYHARWAEAREMIRFGGKSLLPNVARLLRHQAITFLLLDFLGLGAVALYSRPRALVHHVTVLVRHFASVLTPTASSLGALGRKEDLRRLLIETSYWSLLITLPMVLVLAILGKDLLTLWMGPSYAAAAPVLAILALGEFPSITQRSVYNILKGLDAHGLPGVVNLIASTLSCLLAYLALGVLEQGLVGTAAAVALPLALANGVFVPIYACRRLGLPVLTYLAAILVKPTVLSLPFALTLLVVASTMDATLSVLLGVPLGGAVLALTYWHFALTREFKLRITRRIAGRESEGGSPVPTPSLPTAGPAATSDRQESH